MNPLYIGLFFALLVSVMPLIGKVLKKKRGNSEKYQKIMEDFQISVQSALTEGEVVEAVCGYVPCAAVTNKRLLIGAKTGLETVHFADITSLKGMNGAGDKTSNPDQMLVFSIKANKKYVLGNHSEGFNEVVTSLFQYTGL